MKSTWKIIGTLFVCLTFVFGITACDEDENGENNGHECEVDENCEADEVCVSQQCELTCDDDDQCAAGEACETRPDGGDEMICVDSDETAECDDDSECVQGKETCEEDDSVDAFGTCEEIQPGEECEDHDECLHDNHYCDDNEGVCADLDQLTYGTVLIEDVTDQFGDADRCGDQTYGYATSGVKVFDIVLYDPFDDVVVEYAEAIDFVPGSHDEQGVADFGDAFSIFDGQAPDFEHQCPNPETFERLDNQNEVRSTFHEDAVLALGCGGQLFVRFLDGSGNTRILDENYDVDVYVYGQTCSDEMFAEHSDDTNVADDPQSTDDPYDVYLCNYAGSGPVPDVDADCDVRLNDDPVNGHGFLPIQLPF